MKPSIVQVEDFVLSQRLLSQGLSSRIFNRMSDVASRIKANCLFTLTWPGLWTDEYVVVLFEAYRTFDLAVDLAVVVAACDVLIPLTILSRCLFFNWRHLCLWLKTRICSLRELQRFKLEDSWLLWCLLFWGLGGDSVIWSLTESTRWVTSTLLAVNVHSKEL